MWAAAVLAVFVAAEDSLQCHRSSFGDFCLDLRLDAVQLLGVLRLLCHFRFLGRRCLLLLLLLLLHFDLHLLLAMLGLLDLHLLLHRHQLRLQLLALLSLSSQRRSAPVMLLLPLLLSSKGSGDSFLDVFCKRFSIERCQAAAARCHCLRWARCTSSKPHHHTA